VGGKGEGIYPHGHDHPKEEVKMPDGGDATGRSKAHGQEDCTKGKEHAGTNAIDKGSRRHGEEGMDHHREGKRSCCLRAAPAVFLEDGNVKHPKGIPNTKGDKEGKGRDAHNYPPVIEAGFFPLHYGYPCSENLRILLFPSWANSPRTEVFIHGDCGSVNEEGKNYAES
jgi:hypothetical protein